MVLKPGLMFALDPLELTSQDSVASTMGSLCHNYQARKSTISFTSIDTLT